MKIPPCWRRRRLRSNARSRSIRIARWLSTTTRSSTSIWAAWTRRSNGCSHERAKGAPIRRSTRGWCTRADLQVFLKEFGADDYFVNDTATASRTGVFDIDAGEWSQEIIDALGLDVAMFPRIVKEFQSQ